MMERRSFLALLAAGPAVIAACGSDGTTLPPADTTAASGPEPIPGTTPEATLAIDPEPTVPPATEVTTEPDVDASGGGDGVILALTDEGGFTTREFAFQNPPVVLVTADGRVITPAITTAEFPGPMLPQHMVQTITPDAVDRLLTAVSEAGLAADLDLAVGGDIAIADASTTVLVVDSADLSIRHEAYALGVGAGPPGDSAESSPDRQAFLEFVDRLRRDLASVVGGGLGEPEPWTPDAVQITVMSMAGVDLSADATIVDWPADATVPLATSGVDSFSCREVDDPAIVEAIVDADQTTFFRDPNVPSPDDVFQVIARPAYPGRACDA